MHTERIVVGMAAVLEERKGHRFLLEAARRLKAQGCQIQYRLAGDGSLRKSLEETATRLGLKDDVQFLGFVSDMPAFLSQGRYLSFYPRYLKVSECRFSKPWQREKP